MPIGTLAGLEIDAEIDRRIEDEVRLAIRDSRETARLSASELADSDPSTLVTRLERRIQNLDSKLTAANHELAEAESEAEHAETRIGAPFEHADELHRLRRRQAETNDQLLATDEPASATPPDDAAAQMREWLDRVAVASGPGIAR